jgi:hypothetical protein
MTFSKFGGSRIEIASPASRGDNDLLCGSFALTAGDHGHRRNMARTDSLAETPSPHGAHRSTQTITTFYASAFYRHFKLSSSHFEQLPEGGRCSQMAKRPPDRLSPTIPLN